MEPKCFNCDDPLVFQRSQGAFECKNENCEINGLLKLCEICDEYSLTGTPLQCINPICPSYHKPRTTCPDCKMTSLITINKMPVCLNSECLRNENIGACWFCEELTLSKAANPLRINVCRNKDCQSALKLIRTCPICAAMSFDMHQGRCLNNLCPSKGVQVTICPACGKKRYFGDYDTREYLCTNTKCDIYFKRNPEYVELDVSPVVDFAKTQDQTANIELPLSNLGDGQTMTLNPSELQEVIAESRPTSVLPSVEESNLPMLKKMEKDISDIIDTDESDDFTKPGELDEALKTHGKLVEEENGAKVLYSSVRRMTRPKDDTDDSEYSGDIRDDDYIYRSDNKIPVASTDDRVDKTSNENVFMDERPKSLSDSSEFEISADMEQDANFDEAYRYLQKTMLNPPGEEPAPLYLMLGLAGVGKTCYLTMLGQVLQGQQFYTPRSDIRPQMVHIDPRYSNFVSDLVYGFSSEKYEAYLSRGNWPPADTKDTQRKFLVTQLVLPDGSIAKLVTLEIRGEVYEEFLPDIVKIFQSPEQLKKIKPEHRIIWELIKQAEGIVILFDVSSALQAKGGDSKISIFTKFFQALIQWKEIEVKKRLNVLFQRFTEYVDSDHGRNNFFLTKIIASHKRKIGPMSFNDYSDDYIRNSSWLISELAEKGINNCLENDEYRKKFMKLWNAYIRAKLPIDQAMSRLNDLLQNRFKGLNGSDNGNEQITNFLSDFLKTFSKRTILEQIYYSEYDAESVNISQWWPVFVEYLSSMVEGRLHESYLKPLGTSNLDFDSPNPRSFFDKLRYIAITFTKTDRDYAIYPASNFPNLVDLNLAEKLKMLSTYLSILDGYLRFYNGSVSGYSVQKDGNYSIGEGSTLTPINVAEPFLDMLSHRMQNREILERLLFDI